MGYIGQCPSWEVFKNRLQQFRCKLRYFTKQTMMFAEAKILDCVECGQTVAYTKLF